MCVQSSVSCASVNVYGFTSRSPRSAINRSHGLVGSATVSVEPSVHGSTSTSSLHAPVNTAPLNNRYPHSLCSRAVSLDHSAVRPRPANRRCSVSRGLVGRALRAARPTQTACDQADIHPFNRGRDVAADAEEVCYKVLRDHSEGEDIYFWKQKFCAHRLNDYFGNEIII
jgi:hypothetical protein